MIQLGSILAIMWLYREKIIHAVTGLTTRPDSRNFALAIIVATTPALIAGALFSKFIKSVLYESPRVFAVAFIDRKSTRLNSSHLGISYAVFCLKKKKNNNIIHTAY